LLQKTLTRSVQMKFKIASILELIIPVSMALMLSAFLGCGGGSSTSPATPYDGTWSLNLKGYTVPTAVLPDTSVTCIEAPTFIVISHGSGTISESISCRGQPSNTMLPGFPGSLDIGITLAADGADATGNIPITGIVKLETTGGGTFPSTGVCINRVTCAAGASGAGLFMTKCGEAASGC
jgi:hypothetical protein